MKIKKEFLGVLMSVVICILLVFAGVYATTTVGNDVTIGGTLTATGIVSFGSTASITDDLEVGGSIFYVNVGSQSYNFGGTGSASFAGPVNIIGDFAAGNPNTDMYSLYTDSSNRNIMVNYTTDFSNYITGGTTDSSILGGAYNSITGSGNFSFIGGGGQNSIIDETESGNFGRNAIVGGASNTIDVYNKQTTDYQGGSFIGGGGQNTIKAMYATIPGGYNNVVSGSYGFAAGRRAQALAQGDFALSDSTDADFTINTADVFGARFSGGYYLTGGTVSVSSSGIRLDEGVMITTGLASPSGDCGVSGSLYIDKANAELYICGTDAAWNVK